jgi:hypothetical protein
MTLKLWLDILEAAEQVRALTKDELLKGELA